MCTIQLCCRAEGEQPRIAIIFRGAHEAYYTKKEADLYDKRVDVYYQRKAWADRPTSQAWIEKTFAKHMQRRAAANNGVNEHTVLFCDNLDAHTQPEFLAALHRFHCFRHLLVAGETEMLQPIDSGIGAIFKMIMGQVQDEWLDLPGNLDAWEGNADAILKMDTSYRRVLITRWAAEAWERMTTDPHYEDTFRKCFVRTGALLTIEGTDDAKVQPMVGLLGGYKVPPVGTIPVLIAAPAAAAAPAPARAPAVATAAPAQVHAPPAAPMPAPIPPDEDTEEVIDDDDGSVVDDDVEAEEEFREPNDDEEEDSWQAALFAAENMPQTLLPCEGFSVTMSRMVGKYALKYIDGEWDVVKIDASRDDAQYRYRIESNRLYGVSEFLSSAHGRKNPSIHRWVLLTPTGSL